MGQIRSRDMKLEQGATLAEACEEHECIQCSDDITGKELSWQAVKEAREKELKYLRELGVYDTDKAFEDEPMQIRSRIVARKLKNGDTSDLYAGTPPLEALKAIISIAACHSQGFSLMHVDVSPCVLPCQGSEALCW